MYAFGRPRRGLVWALVALQMLGLLGGRGGKVYAHPKAEMKVKPQVFSPEWLEEYSMDELGCGQGRVTYTWRGAGFGSNINNLINAWVYAVVVEGWSDIAILLNVKMLKDLECSKESGGLETQGWGCIFSNMPHLCTFDSVEAWKRYMASTGVSADDQAEASRLAKSLSVIRKVNMTESFEVLDVDQRGAQSVMTTFMWNFFTPWVRKDVHVATHIRETFQTSPFIGIHVRRGDKVGSSDGEFRGPAHSVESYLAEAVNFLEHETNGTSVDAIKGIWVASDHENIVDEVQKTAGAYFPSVLKENIVYVAGGVPGGPQSHKMVTHTNAQGYGSFVYLLADLEQLVAADVFVGTFSSNLGRLVMVLRDGLGKDRDSGISMDVPWTPNRQRMLVLN